MVSIAVFASGGSLWNHVSHHGELYGDYVAKYEQAAIAASQGRLPLWNPYEFNGVPLLGTVHGAMLYPPVIVANLLFTPKFALAALYFFHVGLLAWGITVYLSGVGLSPWMGGVAALVALAGTSTGPAYVGLDHPPFVMCLSWVPIQLIAWSRAIQPNGQRWIAVLALAVCASWLAGYPQFVPSTGVVLFLFALLDDGRSPFGTTEQAASGVPLVRRVAILVAGFALGTALAAPQILPLLELAGQTGRPDALSQIAAMRDGFRVDSFNRLAFLTPIKGGLSAALVLAVASLLAWEPRRRGWLLALLWSVFPINLPFGLLYRLPPLQAIRLPYEWTSLASLFLGFLAAAGAATLLAARHRWLRLGTVAAVVIAMTQAIRLVYAAPTKLTGGPPPFEKIAERLAFVRAAREALAPSARFLGAPEIRTEAALLHQVPSPVGFESALRLKRMDRILTELGLGHHATIHAGVARWAGVARNPELAALTGVGFVIAPRRSVKRLKGAGFTPIGIVPGRPGSPAVVMFRRPFPRAWLVHRTWRAADEDAAFAFVVAHAAELREVAVVETDAAFALAEPAHGASEYVRIVRDDPERLEIEVEAASPGILVVNDNEYPGWVATVDGRRAPIERVDYAFRGVAVDSGTHRMVFSYEPASVRWGFVIAGTALVLLVLLLVPRRARLPSVRARQKLDQIQA